MTWRLRNNRKIQIGSAIIENLMREAGRHFAALSCVEPIFAPIDFEHRLARKRKEKLMRPLMQMTDFVRSRRHPLLNYA